ncbi:MAG TPA: NADH-quinone oxidoreductase subunit N [Gemmataceae bacterium]|jgi:NADH-quinone oxidoreductase subunit N|nr:NADH-quinone oxidoreductase subunit N [Gemmataceae bacterium]
MFPSSDFVSRLSNTLEHDLFAFLPELILCVAIVGMLFARLFTLMGKVHLGWFALVMTTIAFGAALCYWPSEGPWEGTPRFGGLLVFDTFGLYFRLLLLAFLGLSLWLSLITGIPDREDSVDYITLLMGGTLGMMLMASTNHLLTMFIAIEMASVPSYALAGFLKGKRQGSEAALKYVVYGASAAGVMLYGISLICGAYGTGSFPALVKVIGATRGGLPLPVVAGSVCVAVGLAFKLAAVPFHFWCPDVFEGAAAEVGAFLSVASKAAALALTARFMFTIASTLTIGDGGTVRMTISLGFGVFAAITATFGNLVAIAQTNLKRLLAYSTIAHAGIMMMALVPVGPRAVGPVLYYVSAYLLMNLGGFAVVALVRNLTGREDIDGIRGLGRRSPVLAAAMAFFLLSLLGLPPLAGFAAKFQVFAVLYETGRDLGRAEPFFGWFFFGLLAVAALNTAISAGYYLKVVRAMLLDEPTADAEPIAVPLGGRLFVTGLAVLILVTGILWNPLTRAATDAGHSFDGPPESVMELRP